jgi:hypothetical protein
MISNVRKRLTYANVTATLALFFAMSGGAMAASHYLITSTKQIKPSVLKSLVGKPGVAGKNGSNGVNGAAGEKGATGATGASGSPGASGQSVASTELTKGSAGCREGGAEFKAGSSSTFACNGKEGKAGKEGREGSPWTAGGTLPAEKTETGAWSYGPINEELTAARTLVITVASFAIPLPGPLSKTQVHYINTAGEEVTEAGNVTQPPLCQGTVEKPAAAPGNLCIYGGVEKGEGPPIESGDIQNPATASSGGASTTGAKLDLFIIGLAAEASGTWAVTAPAA